jgi:hypothetical protein
MTDPRPTLSEISSPTYLPGDTVHEHNRQVLVMLKTLGSSVRSNLECLEVAEALDQIMLCLKQVCIVSPQLVASAPSQLCSRRMPQ